MSIVNYASIRKILDSRGRPTVEVELATEGGFGKAAAPSGASTGKYEVCALPKKGIDEAVRLFETEVAPEILGLDSEDQRGFDETLKEIDGTANFSRIGGNAAVATSLACAKASADELGLPLFRYVGGSLVCGLPVPCGNVIGGGAHAIGGTNIQEYMALSLSDSFSKAAFGNAAVHAEVKARLSKLCPGSLGKGDEGAWVAQLGDEEALKVLSAACGKVGGDLGFEIKPGLDVAASEIYSGGKYRYGKKALSVKQQIDFMESLVEKHGIIMLEDPLDEGAFEPWAELTDRVGDKCLVVGDDLYVTNPERIAQGIEVGATNAVLIKPNQIGTLTDTIAAVKLSHSAGFETVVSHRSGETTDATIAHLATAFCSFGIKTGTVGGERTAKLNELIRIEEMLE
jgi:enolase